MAQHASTPKGSQQLFDLLKKDHRQAEKLMQQISSAAHDKREELFFELRRELTEHMQMEEKEFYPKLQKVAEMEDQVEDALQEHKEAREYLADLEDFDQDEDDWTSSFQDMQEAIQHHVEDEEEEIFPACREHLGEEQLAEIAQKCQQIKEKSTKGASSSRPSSGKQRQTRKPAEAR